MFLTDLHNQTVNQRINEVGLGPITLNNKYFWCFTSLEKKRGIDVSRFVTVLQKCYKLNPKTIFQNIQQIYNSEAILITLTKNMQYDEYTYFSNSKSLTCNIWKIISACPCVKQMLEETRQLGVVHSQKVVVITVVPYERRNILHSIRRMFLRPIQKLKRKAELIIAKKLYENAMFVEDITRKIIETFKSCNLPETHYFIQIKSGETFHPYYIYSTHGNENLNFLWRIQ